MLDDKLSEGLTNPVAATILRHLVELVVGDVELVLWLGVCPQPLAWTGDLLRCEGRQI